MMCKEPVVTRYGTLGPAATTYDGLGPRMTPEWLQLMMVTKVGLVGTVYDGH